jgi:hypothetical protein
MLLAPYCHSRNNWGPRNGFQRVLVPIYYRKTVEKPELTLDYYENGSISKRLQEFVRKAEVACRSCWVRDVACALACLFRLVASSPNLREMCACVCYIDLHMHVCMCVSIFSLNTSTHVTNSLSSKNKILEHTMNEPCWGVVSAQFMPVI